MSLYYARFCKLGPNPERQVYGAAGTNRQAMKRPAGRSPDGGTVAASGKLLRPGRGANRIVKRDAPDSFYPAFVADGDLWMESIRVLWPHGSESRLLSVLRER